MAKMTAVVLEGNQIIKFDVFIKIHLNVRYELIILTYLYKKMYLIPSFRLNRSDGFSSKAA